MLRAVSALCVESQALELCSAARRDVFKVFRTAFSSNASSVAGASQTVVSNEAAPPSSSAPSPPRPPPHVPPPPPPPPPARRAWPAAALAFALTSLGGVYFYRKLNESNFRDLRQFDGGGKEATNTEEEPPYPSDGAAFPEHVEFLLVGAGTASFAAMRAIRAARPAARVLMVGDEHALPYMRPPLSKELWREPELASRAARADDLTFRQWNGKRRNVVYEPAAFYAPVEELAQRETGGAAVAKGWRVTKLDVASNQAELEAPGRTPVTLRYDKALVATGARPRRLPALRPAALAGRSLALRSLRDAAQLAEKLDDADVRVVAVVGGGFLATELSAALADRLKGRKEVLQVVGESAPMAGVLPLYLARDAQRRLGEAGVRVLANADVADSAIEGGRVRLSLADGGRLYADLVVECAGAEPDPSLAEASGLETHPELGGLLVNAELQARSGVYVAGDAACFYDVVLGRRRVEHHDHAVVSGRLAGENMAAVAPPKHYKHQSMFWSDLGPQLGYEAIGIIDSRLPTVGVFSADAVAEQPHPQPALVEAVANVSVVSRSPADRNDRNDLSVDQSAGAVPTPADERRYQRGVVFYLRERRVVGVLLWNLFNRMHVARQVLAQGEFEDLFEVGKLFAPHEEE